MGQRQVGGWPFSCPSLWKEALETTGLRKNGVAGAGWRLDFKPAATSMSPCYPSSLHIGLGGWEGPLDHLVTIAVDLEGNEAGARGRKLHLTSEEPRACDHGATRADWPALHPG